MNIFLLDKDLKKNAEYLCDIHLRKMIVESYQLLNNSLPSDKQFYKETHKNHPCSLWVKKDINNYRTLVKITFEYLKEYEYRFDKKHACSRFNLPYVKEEFIKKLNLPKCMPDEFKQEDVILSYRTYYKNKVNTWKIRTDKRKIFAKWTKRNIPEFMLDKEL